MDKRIAELKTNRVGNTAYIVDETYYWEDCHIFGSDDGGVNAIANHRSLKTNVEGSGGKLRPTGFWGEGSTDNTVLEQTLKRLELSGFLSVCARWVLPRN